MPHRPSSANAAVSPQRVGAGDRTSRAELDGSGASVMGSEAIPEGQRYVDWEGGLRRSESGAAKLRRRIGSLRIRA